MKFTLVSVFLAVTIASVTRAQLPFGNLLLGQGLRSVGNRAYNRLFGTTTPALPIGYLGTRVANAMSQYIPGAKDLAPRTIRASGEFLNSLEDDMQRISEGILKFNVTGLSSQTANAITGAVDSIGEAISNVYSGFEALISDMMDGNVQSLMHLPVRMMQTSIISGIIQLFTSITTLLMNGIPIGTILPTSLWKMFAVLTAIFNDVNSSPGAFMMIFIKMIVPAQIAAFL